MKRFALLMLLAVPAFAQTVRLGDVNMRNVVVVTNETDAAALAALYGTNAILRAAITNEAALREAHTNDMANPHVVTAAQIGALTNETDAAALAALAAHAAYWPPDATASSWFCFVTNSGYITLTSYNIAGGVDVVVPDFINGLPVKVIGSAVFSSGWPGKPIKSLGGANKVKSIGGQAFSFCTSLALASFPQVTNMGHEVFFNCTNLKSVIFGGNAPTIVPLAPGVETLTFGQIASNQVTVFTTDPLSTGWGATLGGMPVVRLPLYGDRIYQAGQPVATEAHVAEAIAAIPEPDLSGKVDVAGGIASNLWLQGDTIVSDSYTNLWWRNVFSNGWHWLVAYTNALAGGGE